MKRSLAVAAVSVGLLLLSLDSSLAVRFITISVEVVLALAALRQLVASVRERPVRPASRSLTWILALASLACLSYLVHDWLFSGSVLYWLFEKGRFPYDLPWYWLSEARTAFLACIAFIIATLATLAFLNRLTRFPRWTRSAGAIALVLLVAGIVRYRSLLRPLKDRISYDQAPYGLWYEPTDRMSVVVRARETLREGTMESDETYEIVPAPSASSFPLRVNRLWLHRQQGLKLISERPLVARGPNPRRPAGFEVHCHRSLWLHPSRIGLLRSKVELPSLLLMLDVSTQSERRPGMPSTAGKVAGKRGPAPAIGDEPPPYPGQPESAEPLATDRWRANLSGEIEIDLPSDLYLVSLPKGKLTVLPDRDHLQFAAAEASQGIDLYYLHAPRIDLLRRLLGEGTDLDLVLKLVAFLFWPVALLLVGAAQQSVRDRVVLLFGRKRPKSRAGF